MNYLKLFKSKSLLLCGIIFGVVMIPALSANAQCVAKHYLKRHGSSACQAAGLNPYTGRYVFSVYFTPLQNQLYGGTAAGCGTCAAVSNPEVYMGEVSSSEAIITEETPQDPKPEIKDAGGDSIPSPSDVIIEPPKPGDAIDKAESVNWRKRRPKLIG